MALSDADSPIDFPMASASVGVCVCKDRGRRDRRDEGRGGQISAVRLEDG